MIEAYHFPCLNMIVQVLGIPQSLAGSSGFCVETRSILIEYPQNSPKSLAQ
ncbi:hypothetical protein [Microcystis aeruginosa]|uniref:Uncharacterized protein n=1 Tax=Microcystis aeruginosa FD4 TaxID=2686288 RepID=A0A857D539_MICAE|nr:hypothetical protein [Microcystis aeruginosa]MDB9421545.1 hypothetical protein [Microcystis aeruginosa CS-563/04]QGZ90761.1 hypothetical protein GQR42_15745 [Microcystis aeruginosa FD4]